MADRGGGELSGDIVDRREVTRNQVEQFFDSQSLLPSPEDVACRALPGKRRSSRAERRGAD